MPMARCAFCKAGEPPFYEYGVPICPDCLDIGKPNPNRITGACFALVHDLTEATVRLEAAAREFTSILDDIPSGLPPTRMAFRVFRTPLASWPLHAKKRNARIPD